MKQLRTQIISVVFYMILFASQNSNAQTWQWAYGSNGTTGMCEAYGSQCISADNYGYIYTVSRVEPTFGPTTLGPYALPTGSFIVKTNAATGAIIWIKSGYNTYGYNSLISDKTGNLYYTSSFGSTISFGTYTLTPSTSSVNFCLAKFDSSGTVLWAKQSNNVSDQRTNDIALDNRGYVYVIGEFNSPSLILGSDTLSSNTCGTPTCYGTFLAKYNATSGNVVWAKSIVIDPPSSGFVIGNSITVDTQGNVFVVGNYGGTTAPASLSSGIDTVLLPGTYGMILAKFDSMGNSVWIKPTKNLVTPNLIRTDGSGNIYLTGDFKTNDTLYGTPLLAIGSKSVFIAKFNQLGNIIWMKEGGYHGMSYGAGGMYVYPDGKLYITGGEYPIDSGSHFTFNGSTFSCIDSELDLSFIIKLDSSGNVLSGFMLNSGGDDWLGITVDTSNNLYISGDYIDSLILQEHTPLLNPVASVTGHETFFVAKYGNYTEAIHLVGSGSDQINIFPNPVSNELTIVSTGKINSITIYNMIGQVIHTHNYNRDKVQVDVADLPKGIYFVKVNGTEVRKFLKE